MNEQKKQISVEIASNDLLRANNELLEKMVKEIHLISNWISFWGVLTVISCIIAITALIIRFVY